MASQIMILAFLCAYILRTSAFTSTSLFLKRCGVETMRERQVLLMAPRVSKDTFRSSDSLIMKLTRAKKSYNVPGYVRGDYDQIRAVFFLHSVDEKMTYEAFLDSKYLRFWPGRKCDAVAIWSKLTNTEVGSLASVTKSLLPLLLYYLDNVAEQTELEMEQERLAWELEEIKVNFLDKYFETAARGRKLHFTDFISWESVQVEIWYNKRGLTEAIVADIWEGVAGCVTEGVDKDTFHRIFRTVCRVTYSS